MKKDCVYEKKCYRHGSALNVPGENRICNNGEWEEGLPSSPGLDIAPGEGMSDI